MLVEVCSRLVSNSMACGNIQGPLLLFFFSSIAVQLGYLSVTLRANIEEDELGDVV